MRIALANPPYQAVSCSRYRQDGPSLAAFLGHPGNGGELALSASAKPTAGVRI